MGSIVDWQQIVNQEARSRNNFILTQYEDMARSAQVFRLVCTCCNAYVEYRVWDETFERVYDTESLFRWVITHLVRKMLEVNTDAVDRLRLVTSGSLAIQAPSQEVEGR